jgi:hypothetical protein
MDAQSIINFAGGASLAVGGWFARQLWDAMAELRRDMHALEIDLPKNYVRKDEFANAVTRIESMLEKIFDRLNEKADK